MSDQTRRMQVKVLYSFNNNSTIFLSRSKSQYAVKVATIPLADDQELTLGAFDLKSCVQQIMQSSPENFKLNTEDYVVYYKDTTEQPDEPFVANGSISSLVSSTKQHLIPGRVCQNLSASYLFGDQSSGSSLTLEVRLKLHTVELSQPKPSPRNTQRQPQTNSSFAAPHQKRPLESPMPSTHKKTKHSQSPAPVAQQSTAAVKATRTKSLPIFNNVPSQTMFNIMHHDKLNLASKYDSKSVQDRFKSAPFFQAKIIDKPVQKHRRYADNPQRAMRTRSMVHNNNLMISSPINEEHLSDSTDDTEYRESNEIREEDDEEDDEEQDPEFGEPSPYTPQQPPYDTQEEQTKIKQSSLTNNSKSRDTFQALPDLEDLDSKRTHTIPHTKLPKNHGLVCVNSNCATVYSIAWRYFETEFHPSYFAIHRAKEFDKKHYEGMFGPLCNACYLFLRNKGFMRPENVVKKYLQQQRYKKDLKNREELNDISNTANSNQAPAATQERSNSLTAIAIRKANSYASSPAIQDSAKFPPPSHTPYMINQAIQNNNSHTNEAAKRTPNYDSNEFLNQLNNFGGPLTDIDPLPQDQIGVTPPMMATKCNTRVINLCDDGEDKENCPPPDDGDIADFEQMIRKSFHNGSEKSSPIGQSEWINTLFTEPTPKDQITPRDSKTPNDENDKFLHPNMPNLKTFSNRKPTSPVTNRLNNKKATVVNMPSSPFLNGTQNSDELESLLNGNSNGDQNTNNENTTNVDYSEMDDEIHDLVSNNHFAFNPNSSSPKVASRNDTTNSIMSWSNNQNNSRRIDDLEAGSTPNTDLFSTDDAATDSHDKAKIKYSLDEMLSKKSTH